MQFAVIQPQAAAHASGVFRIHVRIDEIGKIGNSVFGRHLPNRVKAIVVPVKFLADVVSRNRESKHSPAGVPFHHHFRERPIYHIHFFLKLSVSFLPGHSPDNYRLFS